MERNDVWTHKAVFMALNHALIVPRSIIIIISIGGLYFLHDIW